MIAPNTPKPIYRSKRAKRTPQNAAPGTLIKGVDGRWHHYLNAALPDGQPIDATFCGACSHGYAELARTHDCGCDECRLERQMEAAQAIQDECGVTLIPKTPDAVSIRAVYGYRDRPIAAGGYQERYHNG